ncbi:MAG TPA: amylo-alpha-1,6-glucosidase [Stenomitos sp.]
MQIEFGREICGNLSSAEAREWLVTNGIGGYACGTVANLLTRRYHGLLIAALQPPLGRTLLLAKLDETVTYDGCPYPLSVNRWANGTVEPNGHHYIEHFRLDNGIPVWRFACADALLEKRIWMQQGANTTYVSYTLVRATQPLHLSLQAFVNYRDHHSDTHANHWQMHIVPISQGLRIQATPKATPLDLVCQTAQISIVHEWYRDFDLAVERYRGLCDREDHLHAGTFTATLQAGESLTFVASTDPHLCVEPAIALQARESHSQNLLHQWQKAQPPLAIAPPSWMAQLVLAADQFVVARPTVSHPDGQTIIAGYPWFSDWGRDTMISLPGLALTTGRPELARSLLCTFAQYVDQGMIPNRFPDAGERPDYNTVDATLWYIEAVRAYHSATGDDSLLEVLFPVLADIIDWHCRGTRYQIRMDSDGLLAAGEEGVQLTWMDAKVGDWVVTPRIGTPIEINALWYNALHTMNTFAHRLGHANTNYAAIAQLTQASFSRFWNAALGYCYDVLDGPDGHDAALRPNQLFAIVLPKAIASSQAPLNLPLLTPTQQRAIVDLCGRKLLTSHGLRSLSPDDPRYQPHYGGTPFQRDGAYHQGAVWGWLIGPFVQAHLWVYDNPQQALQFLEPMAQQLLGHGLGTLSEIFDGDAPMTPRGCFAQAWTVAEVLNTWQLIAQRLTP